MRITDMNWMQVEAYLEEDDRCVLPLGSTEQHAYLSLSVDSILAERLSLEVAEPLGVPVFPVLHYGVTPYFLAFPGTVSIRLETYFNIVRDMLDSLAVQGFRRVLLINGHGGNIPVANYLQEWVIDKPDMRVQFHSWWTAPKTLAKVREIDPIGSHASWLENFAWTRLANAPVPDEQKPMIDNNILQQLSPPAAREYIGDGNFGGVYQRSDDEMQQVWDTAIEETRARLTDGWA